LVFTASGDTLTGSTLTLDTSSGYTPTISVESGNNSLVAVGTRATISSVLAGNEGLTKTGNGTLVLGGTNTYTGPTIVQNGTLIAATQAQLGNSTGFISVMGGGSVGFAGGTLVLGSGSIISPSSIFTRDISVSGRGATVFGAGSLQLIGNNTFSGLLSTGSNTESRFFGGGGLTTLSGKVRIGSSEMFLYGNTVISGTISGGYAGNTSITKAATTFATQLAITGTNTMLGGIRAEGFVRITDGAQLGLSTDTGSNGGNLNYNGGTFELRSDTFSSFATKNISQQYNGGTLFVDHGIGTLGAASLNTTFSFANFRQENNKSFTFAGRNGTNVLLSTLNSSGNGANGETFTNNLNGQLTFTGNIWGEAATSAQTLTLSMSGEGVVTGSITASGSTHNVTKSGTGLLTIGGGRFDLHWHPQHQRRHRERRRPWRA
jgi:fibronectin-binding autotransporter adhesin